MAYREPKYLPSLSVRACNAISSIGPSDSTTKVRPSEMSFDGLN